MPYTTRQDLERRFGTEEIAQLVDVDPYGSPSAALSAVIDDADALIDGYLGAVARLPLCDPPALIQSFSADITRYRLWDDRAPAEVRKRYDDAIAMLKDIAKGVLRLPVTVVPPATNLGGIIATTDRTRSFTDASLGGFVGGDYPTFGGGRGK